jgi:hypothetical protein
MDKIVYCESCNDDVEFDVRDEIVNVNLKGVKFTYAAIVAYCKKCTNEVSVPDINDLNIIRAYKAQKDTLEKQG